MYRDGIVLVTLDCQEHHLSGFHEKERFIFLLLQMLKDDMGYFVKIWIERAKKAGYNYREFIALEKSLATITDEEGTTAFLHRFLGEFVGRINTSQLRQEMIHKLGMLGGMVDFDKDSLNIKLRI